MNTHQHVAMVEGENLRSEMAQGRPVVMVDVRSEREFNEVHIPGAVNVPLQQFAQVAAELARLTQGRDLVLVCRTDRRAQQARQLLADQGRADARILQGGMVHWIDEDGPTQWAQRPRGC